MCNSIVLLFYISKIIGLFLKNVPVQIFDARQIVFNFSDLNNEKDKG